MERDRDHGPRRAPDHYGEGDRRPDRDRTEHTRTRSHRWRDEDEVYEQRRAYRESDDRLQRRSHDRRDDLERDRYEGERIREYDDERERRSRARYREDEENSYGHRRRDDDDDNRRPRDEDDRRPREWREASGPDPMRTRRRTSEGRYVDDDEFPIEGNGRFKAH